MTDHSTRLSTALDQLRQAHSEVQSIADETNHPELKKHSGTLHYVTSEIDRHHKGMVKSMDTKMQAPDTNVSASGAYPTGDPLAPDGLKTSEDAPANLAATGKVVDADDDVDLTNTKK